MSPLHSIAFMRRASLGVAVVLIGVVVALQIAGPRGGAVLRGETGEEYASDTYTYISVDELLLSSVSMTVPDPPSSTGDSSSSSSIAIGSGLCTNAPYLSGGSCCCTIFPLTFPICIIDPKYCGVVNTTVGGGFAIAGTFAIGGGFAMGDTGIISGTIGGSSTTSSSSSSSAYSLSSATVSIGGTFAMGGGFGAIAIGGGPGGDNACLNAVRQKIGATCCCNTMSGQKCDRPAAECADKPQGYCCGSNNKGLMEQDKCKGAPPAGGFFIGSVKDAKGAFPSYEQVCDFWCQECAAYDQADCSLEGCAYDNAKKVCAPKALSAVRLLRMLPAVLSLPARAMFPIQAPARLGKIRRPIPS